MRVRIAATAAAALLALTPALPAAATEGSVPAEVAEFVTASDGLVAGLSDFFGPGADGKGIDFDDTTVFGTVDRVFTFTPEWLSGAATDAPVGLANEWAVPVSVADDAVGVAIVWINPGTVRPQLADFVTDPAFAEALADVADTAYLVEDEPRAAWFALDGTALTALVAGTSGVDGDTPLAPYQRVVTAPHTAVAVDQGPTLGSVLSVGIIAAVSLVVILVLLVPIAWRRRRARAAADGGPDEE